MKNMYTVTHISKSSVPQRKTDYFETIMKWKLWVYPPPPPKKKKKALVFLNLMFHIFSQEFYWIILLQIPGMDNQPNPAPKIPQEDLDEEVQLTYCEHHNVMFVCETNSQMSTPTRC